MAIFGGWQLTRAGILFIIGILVLGGLVTGGVFLVKNRGEAARRDEAIKVAEQKLKDESEVVNEPLVTTNTTETPTNTTQSGTTAPATNSTSALPETGPEQDVLNVLVVAALALSAAFYVSSRRAAQRL